MSETDEVQIPVQFITDSEFEAKDWPEYSVEITPEFSEEEFQQEFCDIIEQLEDACLAEGWKRGVMKPHDDYDISVESYRPHRSLDLSIMSNRILRPILIQGLVGFLQAQRNRWMIHISDERWTPETGLNVDFKIVIEQDMVWCVVFNDAILDMLEIRTPEQQ